MKKCTDSTSQNSELTVSQVDIKMQPAQEGGGGQVEEQQVGDFMLAAQPDEYGKHAHRHEGCTEHGRQLLLQPQPYLIGTAQHVGRPQS
jgi:hypothetical protein